MAWSPTSSRAVAFEFQHSSISLQEIESRAFYYATQEIAQIWVPFLNPSIWEKAEPLIGGKNGDMFIEQYPAKPFEKWVHGFHGGRGMWFYDPQKEKLWRGCLQPHKLWIEEQTWFEHGEEQSAGGYEKYSRRWRELTLWGPYALDSVKVRRQKRQAFEREHYKWPACWIAEFVTDSTP